MNIKDRILETEKQFEQKKKEREEHLQSAEELLTELTKLQGEWRILQELFNEENTKSEKGKK